MITSFFKPKRSHTNIDGDTSSSSNCNENNENKQKQQRGIANCSNSSCGEKNNEHQLSTNNNTKKLKTGSTNVSPDALLLISYLQNQEKEEDDDDKNKKDNSDSWKCALERHFSTPSFTRLASFVENQRRDTRSTIFPPAQETFTALNWTPLDKVRVVIVGQDPYHGPHQAHGLSFSVQKGVKVPPSLRNIYKELIEDADIHNFTNMPTHGYLERWAKQGVLMINAVMTVRQGEANSHKNKGWEEVTDEIIRAVDRRAKQQGKGVVFLLWGSPATKKAQTALGIDPSSSPSSSRHTIITTSHPSPLGATKTDSPFLGSKCFSRANQALKEMGCPQIDWRVDGEL